MSGGGIEGFQVQLVPGQFAGISALLGRRSRAFAVFVLYARNMLGLGNLALENSGS